MLNVNELSALKYLSKKTVWSKPGLNAGFLVHVFCSIRRKNVGEIMAGGITSMKVKICACKGIVIFVCFALMKKTDPAGKLLCVYGNLHRLSRQDGDYRT